MAEARFLDNELAGHFYFDYSVEYPRVKLWMRCSEYLIARGARAEEIRKLSGYKQVERKKQVICRPLHKWKVEEINMLKDFIACRKNNSVSNLADTFGVSRGSIYTKMWEIRKQQSNNGGSDV